MFIHNVDSKCHIRKWKVVASTWLTQLHFTWVVIIKLKVPQMHTHICILSSQTQAISRNQANAGFNNVAIVIMFDQWKVQDLTDLQMNNNIINLIFVL